MNRSGPAAIGASPATSADRVRAAVRAFHRSSAGARTHVGLRAAAAPLGGVVGEVPAEGRVLDWGCGHGLVALAVALGGAGLVVDAVDIDAAKLAVGRSAASEAGVAGRVTFRPIGAAWRPDPVSFDAVVLADVAYLHDDATIAEMVGAAAAAVRPGGRLVIKDVATTPRWKHRFATLQEQIVVRGLRLTRGATVNPGSYPAVRRAVGALGWAEREVPLDRWYPYPHVVLVADRPGLP